jgi:hypothetical protein
MKLAILILLSAFVVNAFARSPKRGFEGDVEVLSATYDKKTRELQVRVRSDEWCNTVGGVLIEGASGRAVFGPFNYALGLVTNRMNRKCNGTREHLIRIKDHKAFDRELAEINILGSDKSSATISLRPELSEPINADPRVWEKETQTESRLESIR